MDGTIEARGLVKRYGEVMALGGLGLDIPAGTILGLLGPNGAGTTTAVSVLTTLVEPDESTSRVAGADALASPDVVRERSGLSAHVTRPGLPMPEPGETMSTTPTSPKRLARIAGLLYLAVVVLRGLPLLVARPMVHVPGDPAATAEAIAANQTWLRVAFVSELAGIVAFILLVMVLHRLLRHVDRYIAAAMVTFLAIAVAIASVNMINHLAAVVIGADPTLAAALGVQGSEGLMLLFLELHEVGYSIGEVFFGLWLLPLGYLALKSGWFPRPLAVLLMVGCFAYLTLAFTVPLFTRFPETLLLIAAPAGVAQFWMIGYLLTRGVNTTDRQLPTPTPA